MFRKKAKKESAKATLASVKMEMAEPRMAKSAREVDVWQDVARLARNAIEEKRNCETKSGLKHLKTAEE